MATNGLISNYISLRGLLANVSDCVVIQRRAQKTDKSHEHSVRMQNSVDLTNCEQIQIPLRPQPNNAGVICSILKLYIYTVIRSRSCPELKSQSLPFHIFFCVQIKKKKEKVSYITAVSETTNLFPHLCTL